MAQNLAWSVGYLEVRCTDGKWELYKTIYREKGLPIEEKVGVNSI